MLPSELPKCSKCGSQGMVSWRVVDNEKICWDCHDDELRTLRAENARLKQPWVSVKDRLPHDNPDLHQWVYAVNMAEDEPLPFVVGFTYDFYSKPNFECLIVSHWMEIPDWMTLKESEE
jgi:hypothetical protein